MIALVKGFGSDDLIEKWFLNRDALISYCAILIFPLMFATKLNLLARISILGLLSIVYLNVVMFIRLFLHTKDALPNPPIATLPMFNANFSFFVAISIQSAAFIGQFNAISVAEQLQQPTRKRFAIVSVLTVFCCFVLYTSMGVSGFFAFGKSTPPDIVAAFPVGDFLVDGGRIALTIALLLTLPLFMTPLRFTLNELLSRWRLVNDVAKQSMWLHILQTVLLAGTTLAVALLVNNLGSLLGLIGAACGMMIAFVEPGLIGFAFYRKQGRAAIVEMVMSISLVVLGVSCGIIGTVVTIINW